MKSFEQFAGYSDWIENLTGTGEPLRVNCTGITANFLPMLGVVPKLGRLFTQNEDRPVDRQSSFSVIISGAITSMLIQRSLANPSTSTASCRPSSASCRTASTFLISRSSRTSTSLPISAATPCSTPIRGSSESAPSSRLRRAVSIEQAQAELQTFYRPVPTIASAKLRPITHPLMSSSSRCSVTSPEIAAGRSSSFSPASRLCSSSPAPTSRTCSSPAPYPAATKPHSAERSAHRACVSSASSSLKASFSPRSPLSLV